MMQFDAWNFQHCSQWSACVISADPGLAKQRYLLAFLFIELRAILSVTIADFLESYSTREVFQGCFK